jgi:hypothetical protein
MGSSSSQAIACRYGMSFVGMLRERFEEFQGTPQANCWWILATILILDMAACCIPQMAAQSDYGRLWTIS